MRCVRRGNVDRYIIGKTVYRSECRDVVVHGMLICCCLVLANIDANYTRLSATSKAAGKMFHANTRETHAVDNGPMSRQPEHSLWRITALGFWCNGAKLDESKAQVQQGAIVVSVFIETRGDANRVWKTDSHQFRFQSGIRRTGDRPNQLANSRYEVDKSQCIQDQTVTEFCVQHEQQ